MIVERNTRTVSLRLAFAIALALGTIVSTALSVDLWLSLGRV